MDAQIQPEINKGPDFQKIYSEIIEIYHPEKKRNVVFISFVPIGRHWM